MLLQMTGEIRREPLFNYARADWVKQYGLPQHHLRVIAAHVDVNCQRWYSIFDTTPAQGHADYRWIRADELESNSELAASAADEAHASEILQRCEALRGAPYAIQNRLDCESLQRFIHTGREDDRWSPQVWTGIVAALVSACIIAANRQTAGR